MNTQNWIQIALIRLTTFTGVTLINYITLRRHVFQIIAATVFVLAAPLAVHASSGAGGIGSGRLLPSIAGIAGLIGVIIGRRALIRSRSAANERTRALVAAVLGLISLLIGVLHAANSAGGFGTGNGLAGAVVAIALGLIGILLGGLALARTRRALTSNSTGIKTSAEERI
jgi:hypothetical protein